MVQMQSNIYVNTLKWAHYLRLEMFFGLYDSFYYIDTHGEYQSLLAAVRIYILHIYAIKRTHTQRFNCCQILVNVESLYGTLIYISTDFQVIVHKILRPLENQRTPTMTRSNAMH